MKNVSSIRTGAVLPLVALFIATFLFIAALTINSNWFMFNYTNAQNTADISARAALQKIVIDTEVEGRFDRARDLGVQLYDLNIARNSTSFDRDRIRFGNMLDVSVADPEFKETFNEDDVVSAVHVDSPEKLEQQQVQVFFSDLLGAEQKTTIYADAKASTRPIDIILSLDASRSMNWISGRNRFPTGGTTIHEPPLPGSRWFELTDTVELFLDAMQDVNPNARVGLVTFGGGAYYSRNPVSELDEDFARFEKGLTVVIADDIVEITEIMKSYSTDYPALGLGTSLYDGVETAVAAFLDDTDSAKHIVMLSDGDQAAVNRPDSINAAPDAVDAGVTIHTIAFGLTRYNRELADIAEATGGASFEAASEEELKEAFAQLLGRFRVQLAD